MREAIGSTWIYMIAITFMMIMIAFITISINYKNVFKMKTNAITVVEQYQGISTTTLEKIEVLMSNQPYMAKGKCGNGERGVIGKNVETNVDGKKYNYCISSETSGGKTYFTLTFFLNFELPILNNIFDFRVDGETNGIYNATFSGLGAK